MSKDKTLFEQGDQLRDEVERDKQLTQDYDLFKVTWPNKNNGELPKHRFDQGRNCPFCGGRLFHKGELADPTYEESIHLRCAKCHREVFASDVDNPKEITDQLYKTIPLDMMLKWDENRRKFRDRGE